MKICTVIGARPQLVKASALSKVILERENVEEVLIHTGQHFDRMMSSVFFEELQIPAPAYNLGISGLSHGAMTGRMIEELEKVFLKEKPDIIVLYGDTNSTLAGALAGSKMHIPIAHIEAGLRSGNMRMPEEVNRILTDRVSTWLFTPSESAAAHLVREGIPFPGQRVEVVGDIMYDVFLNVSKNLHSNEFLSENQLEKDQFIIATIHRQETVENLENLTSVIRALNQINKDIKVVSPAHPRTLKKIREHKLEVDFSLIEPVSYFDMLRLLVNCRMVITDSGGLQKEAYYAGKYCITVREETEWEELVEAKACKLAGMSEQGIINAYKSSKPGTEVFLTKPYGKGKASQLILDHLLRV